MAITDYFRYEADLARVHLLPWLRGHGALPACGAVLDVGCGYGGTLQALHAAAPDWAVHGIDLDPTMIAAGRGRLPAAVALSADDFFDWSGGPYDLILMRDVLEHIVRPEAALERAARLLKPGGYLFASFAPFAGPFGGHQHNGQGLWARLPWIHLLPEPWFRRLVTLRGNAYKQQAALERDMASVFATRFSLRRFRRGATAAGLCLCALDRYFSRPDYRLKFGWPTLPLPAAGGCEEFLATAIEALLQQPRLAEIPTAP